MKYLLGWGRPGQGPGGSYDIAVSSPADLDTALDAIATTGTPMLVNIIDAWDGHDIPYGLQIGIGTGERSCARYTGKPADGLGYDPAVAPPRDPITFDLGGEPVTVEPERLRLSMAQAREAARQYVATGGRPTCIAWDAPDSMPGDAE